MTWNYRVLAKQYENKEIEFGLYEVYYDIDNKPNAFSKNPITLTGDTLKDIVLDLRKIKKALNKPVLLYGEHFPNEYNDDWTLLENYQSEITSKILPKNE